MNLDPQIPALALTPAAQLSDGPTYEVWTADYVTKFGIVYQDHGTWVAAGAVEFPYRLDSPEVAASLLALFRGRFPESPVSRLNSGAGDLRQDADASAPAAATLAPETASDPARDEVAFTVVGRRNARFAVDRDALNRWVTEDPNRHETRMPSWFDQSAGETLSTLVGNAADAGVLLGDPDFDLAVKGERGSAGAGFWVVLSNCCGPQQAVGLTVGPQPLRFPEGTESLADQLAFFLDQVAAVANSILDTIGRH